MQIIQGIHNNKTKITFSLLFAFSIVFVCKFLCDTGVIDISFVNGIHSHSSKEIVNGGHASHHHDGTHGTEKHDHKSRSHSSDFLSEQDLRGDTSHSGTDDDECCEEETNQLFASLVKHQAPVFDVEKIPVLFYAVYQEGLSVRFDFYKEHNPNRLKNALSPPVDGSFVRILIQSFLC